MSKRRNQQVLSNRNIGTFGLKLLEAIKKQQVRQ